MNVEVIVRRIIADIAEVEEGLINCDTQFSKDLDMDSLDAIEAIVQIENEFSVELPERVLMRISTFGDLVRELKALLKRPTAADGHNRINGGKENAGTHGLSERGVENTGN